MHAQVCLCSCRTLHLQQPCEGREGAGRGSSNCFIPLAAIVELTGDQDCNSHPIWHCTEHTAKPWAGNRRTSCRARLLQHLGNGGLELHSSSWALPPPKLMQEQGCPRAPLQGSSTLGTSWFPGEHRAVPQEGASTAGGSATGTEGTELTRGEKENKCPAHLCLNRKRKYFYESFTVLL